MLLWRLRRTVTYVHDDVIKWKHFPRSPVNSPHKGQWRGALIFTSICIRINGWVNNCDAGELSRNRAHYDVIVMNAEFKRWITRVRLAFREINVWGMELQQASWWLHQQQMSHSMQQTALIKNKWIHPRIFLIRLCGQNKAYINIWRVECISWNENNICFLSFPDLEVAQLFSTLCRVQQGPIYFM